MVKFRGLLFVRKLHSRICQDGLNIQIVKSLLSMFVYDIDHVNINGINSQRGGD